MDVYWGMRRVTLLSMICGVITFSVCSWITIWSIGPVHGNTIPDVSVIHNKIDSEVAASSAGLLRSCIVVLVVSVAQIISALVTFLGPPQGSRARAKTWLGLNACLNMVVLLVFVVTLMDLKSMKMRSKMTDVHDEGQQVNSSPFQWPMTSSIHLTLFFIFVSLDFVFPFILLIISLLIIRFDDNRDYQLVSWI